MRKAVFGALAEGAIDALRLYAALIVVPFTMAKEFIFRAPGEPFPIWRKGERP